MSVNVAEKSKPLVYDPLNPRYGVQHRAGIAGLWLQIEAMRLLREEMSTDEEKAKYIIPDCELTDDGRVLEISFTKESFFSLMRERYRGTWVERETSKKNKDGRLVREWKTETGEKRFLYEELRPLFDYFRVFKAPEAWQAHTRDRTWDSYYSSPPTRVSSFKIEPRETVNEYAEKLWEYLPANRHVKITKTTRLNIFTKDFKGMGITEPAEEALLLHFASIAATIFTPVKLKIERNKQSGSNLLDCTSIFGAPVVVLPLVIHVEHFSKNFRKKLEKREAAAKGKRLHPDLIISSPNEAALAFHITPQLAQDRVAEQVRGISGVEVFSFKPKDKPSEQSVVIGVANQQLDSDTKELLEKYGSELRNIKSLPYRALRVENLLYKRQWYDGFDHLAAQYPLELFVPHKTADEDMRRLDTEAYRMTRSIRQDLNYYIAKKEANMNGTQPNIEKLIYRVTRNYIEWRARDRAKSEVSKDFRFEFDRLNELRRKQQAKLSGDERRWLEDAKKYIKQMQRTAEELFIRFRGCRNKRRFAPLFTETLCFAPQPSLTPDKQTQLRPYIEGDAWESGKNLVLMSISAVGGIDIYYPPDDVVLTDDDVSDTDDTESEDQT